MEGKFFVIEGLDGCGKTTQLNMLTEVFSRKGMPCKYLHYPMLNNGVYGTLVAEFLRGEFGGIEQVHPKLVALLFANDRMESAEQIRSWLRDGYNVLCDRYVYSNIAYQCAKLPTDAQKQQLKDWILQFEFGHNNLPVPYKSLFLHVPFSFVQQSLTSKRTGDDRNYLAGKDDIHEQNLAFQQQVYNEYVKLLNTEENLTEVRCFDEPNCFLDKDTIHHRIMQAIL